MVNKRERTHANNEPKRMNPNNIEPKRERTQSTLNTEPKRERKNEPKQY
jgi:hypothetical protein